MASIILHHVDFAYPATPQAVFRDLSLLIDSGWRAGLVGRNGRGKTTLLRLIAGELEPDAGHLECPVRPRLFLDSSATEGATRDVVRAAVGPFRRLEQTMEGLLESSRPADLERYAEVHEAYVALGGYGIDAAMAREFSALGLSDALLERPFMTLSGGERTQALIVGLFLCAEFDPAIHPLIDEPTNHLDRHGREVLMRYLAGKRGFLLVSHDRYFLDGAVDHVIALNRTGVSVNHGNYTQWEAQRAQALEAERKKRQRIERDVARLQDAARQTRQNAQSREGDKYRTGAFDKGFIGRRAAKQMKRARNVERRISSELDDKRGLLANAEKQRDLKVTTAPGRSTRLVTVQNLTLRLGGRTLCRDLSFAVSPGDRVAIVGRNGCGKTTLLGAISQGAEALPGTEGPVAAGAVARPGHIRISEGHQQPLWAHGRLRDRLADAGLDETVFRQLLGVLGVGADAFERDLATFSHGQLKKVDLCRSLSGHADLLLWDEPLNYVDLYSREQIEAAVLADQPTLVFVEHDRRFVERVATRVIDMSEG